MNQNIQRGSILERNGVRTKRVAGSPKNDNRLATVNLPCVCVTPYYGCNYYSELMQFERPKGIEPIEIWLD